MSKEDKKEVKKELTEEEKAKQHAEKLQREEREACERNKLSNELPDDIRLPLFKDGKAYFIIDDKYVPQDEAEIVFKEIKIKQLQKEVELMKGLKKSK